MFIHLQCSAENEVLNFYVNENRITDVEQLGQLMPFDMSSGDYYAIARIDDEAGLTLQQMSNLLSGNTNFGNAFELLTLSLLTVGMQINSAEKIPA